MARIPDQELDRLKRDICVAELARARGIELKPHGQNLIGLCPFHDDHEPSLVITPERNLWHCLGACQSGGSVVDWVMRAEGVSFRHAVELLRRPAGASTFALDGKGAPGKQRAAAAASIAKRSTARRLPPPLDPTANDRELLGHVVDFYHRTLTESPEAQGYLQRRGLGSAEMIRHFRLGYANRTLGYRLPLKSRRAGAELRARLQRLGILRPSGHEHLAGSLVVPIFDEHGSVTEIYGRKIGANLRKGTARHLYLPGPHRGPSAGSGRGVWNIEALQATDEIILCEALIDAMTFWAAGFRNVTAAYGVAGLTGDHLAAFEKYGTRRVLIAYDRDQAGERAAAKLATKLQPLGIACFRVEFPREMDANAYATKVQPASASLGLLLASARFLGKGAAPPITSAAETPIEIRSEPSAEAAKAGACRGDEETSEPPTRIPPDGITVSFGDRCYRVRGLANNKTYEHLSVSLRVMRAGAYHIDNVDLCRGKDRRDYIRAAAVEIAVEEQVIKKDLAKLLLKLEKRRDAEILAALEPKQTSITLTPEAEARALELLRAPNLMDRVEEHFGWCGVVGESVNLRVAFLAAVSRLLERPLGVLVQSSSAAGKTTLMDAVLAFLPDEVKVRYSALTGQALFYMSNVDLRHKVLAVSEEEGASNATYALKLLASEGELSIASTGKDPHTGKLTTQEYRVTGPVALFSTTTAVELDPELQNRCITLAVDESREQTRRIHRRQRFERTLEGIRQRKERAGIRALHQNAQRLLKPHLVYNPFAAHLGFADRQTTTRRDHTKYLALMDSIALLHQYQRPLETLTVGGEALECVVVTRQDVRLAGRLAAEVLGRDLGELAPHTCRLLLAVYEMVTESCARLGIERSDYRFSRREVREYTGMGHSQLALHLKRLEELEYLLPHRGRRGQSYVYELAWDGQGQDGGRFMLGLIDPEKLSNKLDTDEEQKFPGPEGKFPGPFRGHSGPIPGPFRGGQNGSEPLGKKDRSDLGAESGEKALSGSANGNGARRSRRPDGSRETEPPISTNPESCPEPGRRALTTNRARRARKAS